MRSLAFALLFGLAGCANPVADAEQKLSTVQKSGGSKEEVCSAKREVAEAYLKANDAEGLKTKRLEADLACEDARLDRLYGGGVQPDNGAADLVPEGLRN